MARKFLNGIDAQNLRIINVATGASATDAVNLAQLQALVNGLSWHTAVRAATTANISLSSPGTAIDGVTLAVGDRVLLKNQTTASQNGIYIFQGSTSALTLAPDGVQGELGPNATMFASEGSVNADTTWTLTTNAPITVGTTNLTFAQIGSGAAYMAGNGLTLSGTTFAVDPTVVARKYATAIGDGSSTTITVTHNLGTVDVQVTVRNASTGEKVEADELVTNSNAISLTFGTAPASGAYRVAVIG